MANRYYVNYWRDFGNTYDLCAVCDESDEVALQEMMERGQKWGQITRKKGRELLSAERSRRKTDHQFSGYAPTDLYRAKDLFYKNNLVGDPQPVVI